MPTAVMLPMLMLYVIGGKQWGGKGVALVMLPLQPCSCSACLPPGSPLGERGTVSYRTGTQTRKRVPYTPLVNMPPPEIFFKISVSRK